MSPPNLYILIQLYHYLTEALGLYLLNQLLHHLNSSSDNDSDDSVLITNIVTYCGIVTLDQLGTIEIYINILLFVVLYKYIDWLGTMDTVRQYLNQKCW